MRANIFKRPTSATVTPAGEAESQGTDGSVNGKQPSSDDVELANRGVAELPESEKPSENAQGGVKQAEAITLTWTKQDLITTYVW